MNASITKGDGMIVVVASNEFSEGVFAVQIVRSTSIFARHNADASPDSTIGNSVKCCFCERI